MIGQVSETLTDSFEEREQTLIRPFYHHHADLEEPGEEFEREEVERMEDASERSEVKPRKELLFRGMSKSETKSNKWRKEQSSLVKQSKNAMMSNICPREERTSSKAKKSWKSVYDERIRHYKLRAYLPVMTFRRQLIRMRTFGRAQE